MQSRRNKVSLTVPAAQRCNCASRQEGCLISTWSPPHPRVLAFLPHSKHGLCRLTENSDPGPCSLLRLGALGTWHIPAVPEWGASRELLKHCVRSSKTDYVPWKVFLLQTGCHQSALWEMVVLLTQVTTLIPIQRFNSNKCSSSATCELCSEIGVSVRSGAEAQPARWRV